MENQNPQHKRRTTTLTVDLKELKVPWLAWCEARDITPSEGVRQALQHVLSPEENNSAPLSVKEAKSRRGDLKRLAFSVSATDYDRVASLAAREGMSVARWIGRLLKAHLTGEAQLNDQELQAMLASNRSILALGRGINQIARRMNSHPGAPPWDLASIRAVQAELEAHRGQIRRVLDANCERWRR